MKEESWWETNMTAFQIEFLFVSAVFTIHLAMRVYMDYIQEEIILIRRSSSFRLYQGNREDNDFHSAVFFKKRFTHTSKCLGTPDLF